MTYSNDILTRFNAGTLARNEWTGTLPDGRETACLLVAIAPECGREQSATACPASILPQSFAELVPWMDDNGTLEYWREWVPRFALLADRWHVLTPADWNVLDVHIRIACVEEAMTHITEDAWGVRDACNAVIAALRTGGEKDIAAAGAAGAAARAARDAAGAAARDAAWDAARATAWAAAWAAGAAARAAAWAAAEAAEAAEAAAEAAEAAAEAAEAARAAAGAAAWAAASDRIITVILNELERLIAAREAGHVIA